MKIRQFINAYWQRLLLLLMAVAVFCFWGYAHPEKVVAREAFQMFLWNGDFFADRVAVPGGFARYSGEFLVQFFKFVTLGAAIYALLFTSIVWFSWILLKRALPEFNQMVLLGLSFLPSLFLWFLACNMDVATTLQVAVFFALVLMLALPEHRSMSLICSLMLIPIGYWLTGPLVILIALYHLRWLREKGSRMKTFLESAAMTLLLLASEIDGVGSQMHVSCQMNPERQKANEDAVVNMFNILAKSGKLVKISELDMGLDDENGNAVKTENLTEAQHKAMSDYYKFIISKYFEIIPQAQQYGITQWCITDSPSGSGWRADTPVGLWDKNYNRKHTYAGFADGLSGK